MNLEQAQAKAADGFRLARPAWENKWLTATAAATEETEATFGIFDKGELTDELLTEEDAAATDWEVL